MIAKFARRAASLAKRFGGNERGTYAVMFALAIMPVSGAVALAIDYSIMVRIRTELQAAVDASLLAAAKSFQETYATSQLASVGKDHFESNYTPPDYAGAPVYTLAIGPSGDVNSAGETTGMALTAQASATYQLHFGPLVGMEQSTIRARSTVNVSSSTLEVAFVLDASGSMTYNDDFAKSTKAAHDMLLDLKQYATAMRNATGMDSAYVRYSLVPFAWGVNVGAANRSAAWLDQDGLAAHHHAWLDWSQGRPGAVAAGGGWRQGMNWLTRWTAFADAETAWAGCVEARAHPHFLTDAPADPFAPDTLFVPQFYPDEPDNLAAGEADFVNNYALDTVSGANSTIRLNGSNSGSQAKQIDRQEWTSKYNRHAVDKALFKDGYGPNRNCFDFPVLPLNDDFGQTNSSINNLNVTFSKTHQIGTGLDDGSTNIQQGLVWGWSVLSPHAPFTQGRAEDDPNNEKIVILITDGINSYGSTATLNQSEYAAFGFLSEGRLDEGLTGANLLTARQKLDQQTLATCANMRAAGIELYVVGYGVPADSEAEAMLRACAGGSRPMQYFFSVTDADLAAAMGAIRSQIVDMRLAG